MQDPQRTPVADPKSWQDHLGPFYDQISVSALLSSEARVLSLAQVQSNRDLLALKTGSGAVVYPTFQFQDHKVLPGLKELQEILSPELLSPWTLASWLVSKEPELNDRCPIDALRDGELPAVLSIARQWATALAR